MDQFIANELVWVKLGGVFWPAVVKDKTECSEFLEALKNEPIAVAEFFDKKLQDVHRTCDIFRYNSEEKDELIAKGIQMTKNKVDLALTFKKHVITAEKLSDGDVHILSRSRMSFDQEQDHPFRSVALFNGKAGAQRLPLTNGGRVKQFSSADKPRGKQQATAKSKKSKCSAADNRVLNITHPRFVVENDHCSKDLIQGSGEEAAGASGSFQCYRCPFRCTRVNVIVLHIRAHVRNAPVAGVDAVAAKRRLNGDATAPRKKKAKTVGDGCGVRKTSAKSTDPAKSKKKKAVAGQSNDGKSAGGEVKHYPQKPTFSAKPMLLVDWEEDDDEETAERLKIQSDISKLFGDSSELISARSQPPDVVVAANGPARDDITPLDSTAASVDGASAAADSDSHDGAMFSEDEPSAQSTLVSRLSGEWGEPEDESADEASADDSVTCGRSGGEEDTDGKSDEERHPAAEETDQDEERLERERKDALLLAAVDDVLMETAPSSEMNERLAVGSDVQPVSLRTEKLSDRLRPSSSAECSVVSGVGLSGHASSTKVYQSELERSRLDVESLHTPAVVPSRQPASSGGGLTLTTHTTTRPPVFDVPEAVGQQQPCAVLPGDSAPGAVVSLPANLQVLSVPGCGDADDTFLLVAVDERGDVRAVSPRHSAVAALQSDTLLAYETLQEDGSAGTAYLTPAQLASPSDADIARLLSTAAAADSVAHNPATPSSVAAASVAGVTTALAGSLTEKPLML